jgi:hypothetical protein
MMRLLFHFQAEKWSCSGWEMALAVNIPQSSEGRSGLAIVYRIKEIILFCVTAGKLLEPMAIRKQ